MFCFNSFVSLSPSLAYFSFFLHAHSAAASAGESAGLGMYDRDEVDRGDDEGENWVDVDPQELLALGYSHPAGSEPNTGKNNLCRSPMTSTSTLLIVVCCYSFST